MQRVVVGVVAIAVVAVVLRALAPVFVERYVNRALADMGEYRGRVSSVDLSLLRGGYALHDLEIVKASGATTTPFVTMPTMDLSLQWRALFDGEAVGEAVMQSPVVNFVQSPGEAQSQYGTGVNWPQEIRDLFPFKLNVVRVVDGLVTFRAPGIAAEESMTARDVQVELRNLTNVQGVAEDAFASIDVDAHIMGKAPFKLTGSIDPNESVPTFDVDVSLEGAQLVDINPWLREFVKADAHAGVFSLYAELAAANGRFEGYLKPIMENPEFLEPDEDKGKPFKKAWEALVGFAAKIFENRAEDQVATQVPLSGEFENPNAGLLPAFVNLLRNAFVGAFAHALEGTVSLRDVSESAACLQTAERRSEQCN